MSHSKTSRIIITILLSVLLLVGCSASQSASSEPAKAPQSPEPGQSDAQKQIGSSK